MHLNLFKYILSKKYANAKVQAQESRTLGGAEADLGTDCDGLDGASLRAAVSDGFGFIGFGSCSP